MKSNLRQLSVLAAITVMACLFSSGCSEDSKKQVPDGDVCTSQSCPVGQICDSNTGHCIPDEVISYTCEGIEKPSGATECKCFEDQWYCSYPNEPMDPETDKCKDSNCPSGQKCDPASGDCIPDEVIASDCEGTEKPSDAEECKCIEDQWYCIYPSEPMDPETDKCKDSNCPSGQKCDPASGDCVPDEVTTSDCEGIEQPKGAEDCKCFENKWYCIFPSEPTEPTEPEKDLCAEVNCPAEQACDSKTGKCVAYKTSFLYTEGKNFCTKGTDGKCQKIQLRGFNLGLWLSRSIWGLPIQEVKYEEGEVQPDVNNLEIWYALQKNQNHFTGSQIHSLSEALYDNFISEDDINTLESLGVNAVRVPFEWSHLMLCEQDKQNCIFLSEDDSVLFKHMDWIVNECGKRGIYVIFDLHVAQGNLNTGGHRDKAEFLDEVYKNNIIRIWKRVSNHYKNNTAVAGYDLVNEPEISDKYGSSPAEKAQKLAEFYNEIYKEIRGKDKDKYNDEHILFMEEDCVFCGASNSNGYGSRKAIGLLPDPNDKKWNWTKNVAYSVHNYFTSNKLKADTPCDQKLDCSAVCKTSIAKNGSDDNLKNCVDLCEDNYYECVTHDFFPQMNVFQNRLKLKLGTESDIVELDASNKIVSASMWGVMNSYNIPVYVGEFNSLFYIPDIKKVKEKCKDKSLPACLKEIDTPLKTWEYEMDAYDKAGVSYTAWTYKAAGRYWQSLIYYGIKKDKYGKPVTNSTKIEDQKLVLKKDEYTIIEDVFSRTSKDGSNENTLYKTMFENYFKASKP